MIVRQLGNQFLRTDFFKKVEGSLQTLSASEMINQLKTAMPSESPFENKADDIVTELFVRVNSWASDTQPTMPLLIEGMNLSQNISEWICKHWEYSPPKWR